jgi:hypothetical protein
MQRLRLKVSSGDPSLVRAQVSSRRGYRPFAQAFGATHRTSKANAAMIVKAVNCHNHLIKAMKAIQRTAHLHANGNGERLRTRLKLIARFSRTALSKVEET